MNRIALRMKKIAKETFENLSPEMEQLMMENPKVYKICDVVMMGENGKLTNDVVEAAKYAVDNGFGYGQRLDYFIAYLQARKTTDDIVGAIKSFVDNYKDNAEIDKVDKATFIGLTAGGGFNAVRRALKRSDIELTPEVADEVFVIIHQYFGGSFDANKNEALVGKLANLVVASKLGADQAHLDWYNSYRYPVDAKEIDADVKRELRSLVGANAPLDKLEFIGTVLDMLDEGDASTIVYDYDGTIDELYEAIAENNLDQLLYPGLIEGKLRRAKRTSVARTYRKMRRM